MSMTTLFSPTAWAARSVRNPKAVIGAWIAIFFASIAIIVTLLPSATTTSNGFIGSPESQQARDLISSIGATDHVVETIVLQPRGGNAGPAQRPAVEALATKLKALGPAAVTSVVTPWSPGGTGLVAANGKSLVVAVTMAGDLDVARKHIADVVKVVESARTPTLTAQIVGTTSIEHDNQAIAGTDLQTGESIGIPIALIILLFVFGAAVSALLPLGLAVMSIVVALALVALVGQVSQLSFFVTNMLTMMGLAVGIDYVLFVVSRFREERAAGVERDAAILRAASTAGRAVFFSGITVVVALVGMLIVPTTIFVSLAIGAILVVLVAVAASTTLLPAVLAVLGDRIEKGQVSRLLPRRKSANGNGFWPRIIGGVMKRPGISLVATAAVLMLAAIPYGSITTGFAGLSTMPSDMQSRQASEVLARDFRIGGTSPAVIAIVGDPSSPTNQAKIAAITSFVRGDDVLGTPALQPGATAKGGVLAIPVNADAFSKRAESAVKRLRAGTDLPVGGVTAGNLDFFDITNQYLPIVIGVVLTLSFLVLLLAFRSIVVPIVATLMNLLSVGAAFGLLTLVSQKGYGAGFFGFQQVDTVEAWIPLFLFSVLFGLSMDYHVFLLSRIKERYDEGGDNIESITHGITSSAKLITGAALIMVAVFAGFASGKLVMFQQMGFGLGVAVLIDATIVRSVLVPAAMKLIGGKRNWFLPKSLGWLPKITIEAPKPGGATN